MQTANQLVWSARTFAGHAHGDQKYGSGEPYVCHLDDVATIVEGYGTTAEVIAYLHDVVEDTSVTADDMRAEFGAFVAECVEYVTDCKGANRRERKAATNAKLREVPATHNLALVVKAADRLANLRRGGKVDMYRREHAAFRDAVYRPGLCDAFWLEMDEILGEAV
jgi:(p)ppGpp synthase/HD superfamily hydrolase